MTSTRRKKVSDTRVDILVFGAHADDVELSCGGTVALAVAEGKRVGIVDLTHGEMGTRGTPQTRLRESQEAGKALGAVFRERLDFGDGGLRTGRAEEQDLIRLIRRHQPSIVIAPLPDDRHPDHVRAGRLITEASFYAGLSKMDTGQKAHRPQAILYYLLNYIPHPSFIVDVTSTWKTKQKAINAYVSQFYNPRSKEPDTFIARKSFLDMIDARGKHFGAMIGAGYGEAFLSKQPPRVQDLISAYEGREVS